MSTQLNLIYARAANGVIGQDNAMPWHLPEDLAHFKRVTMGCPVIMGRKTWDSLPERFRPLPGRDNIVITRDRTWQSPGARVAHSLDEAVSLCAAAPQVWVMGGAQIYALALPLAQRVVVTEIDHAYSGDAHAPTLSPAWRETSREAHTSTTGLRFAFVNFERQET
jgi:dihydrofolate reductase